MPADSAGGERAALEGIVGQLEAAWNAMDGSAFAAPFAADADFVNIRGEHFRGRPAIAAGHAAIFRTIYAGSTVQLTVEASRLLRPQVALVHVRSLLDAPQGPLAGRHGALFSLVLTMEPGGWEIAAFHNTLEVGEGPPADCVSARASCTEVDQVNAIIASVGAEYLRYKALAEAGIGQVSESELVMPGPGGGNSILVICWHVAGNLRSRFTDFLTSDGEKPWRNREEEFQDRAATRAELLAHWEMGWSALLDALAGLTDSDLARTVTIRGQPLRVHEALLRSLAHVSYHVGQVVYAARALRGGAWRFLSIPPGQSERYNAQPAFEKPGAHEARLHRPG